MNLIRICKQIILLLLLDMSFPSLNDTDF